MASRLYDYFLSRWVYGTILESQLATAVTKNYITQEEKDVIVSTNQVQG